MSALLTTTFQGLDAEQTVFELDQLLYETDMELRYWELKRERLEKEKQEFINGLKEHNNA